MKPGRCFPRIGVSLAALAMLGGCTAAATAAPSREAVPAARASAEQDLRQGLQRLVEEHRIPGAIVCIVEDGRELAHARAGYRDIASRTPVSDDTIFRLYSMSKPITSVAIMLLAEQGRLSLDDPAKKFLPEFAGMRVYVGGTLDDMRTVPVERPPTIADLLTHSSGLTYHFTGNTVVHQYYRKNGVMRDTPVGRMPGDGAPAKTLDELVARLGKAPMLHQPGEQFAYSYSTTVLGAIVERASGERLDHFLQRHLFDPLQMKHTGFFISDAELPHFTTLYSAGPDGLTAVETPAASDYRDPSRLLDGGGALAGTADDYLRFARMLANGGTLDGRRILSQQSVAAMLTPRIPIEGLGPESAEFGYGFALGTAQTEAKGGLPAGGGSWSGSGNTYFFIDPKRRGVALLMTHFLGSGEAQRALRKLVNSTYYRVIGD